MSLIKAFKRFAGSAAPVGGPRAYIIDVSGTERGKNRRDRMAPGAQVKYLQRLARFTKKEEIPLSALLDGKELRAVQHGGEFQGVKVYFEANPEAFQKSMIGLVRQGLRAGAVTVISDDAELGDAVVSAGGDIMRLVTFRKGLEANGGQGGSGGSGSGSSRASGNSRRQRPRRRRPDSQPRGSVQGGDETNVRDLLDLVE